MTINFENYGKFFACVHTPNAVISYECANGYTLRECADFIEYKMDEDEDIYGADICDNETGEIILTIRREDEEEEEEDWEPDYDECGYNPYLGCCDFDC